MNVRRKRTMDAYTKPQATVERERRQQAETKELEVKKAEANRLIKFVSGKVDDFWTKATAAVARVVDRGYNANEFLQKAVKEMGAIRDANKAMVKDMQAKVIQSNTAL